MLPFLVAAVVAAGAGLWYVSSEEAQVHNDRQQQDKSPLDDVLQAMYGDVDESFTVWRNRGYADQVSLWRNHWALPTSGSYEIQFTIDKPEDRSGMLVCLAKKWKDVSAGGVALVLDDHRGTGAVGMDTSTYFADVPHYDQPRQSSPILHNQAALGVSSYWLRYDEQKSEISFGSGDRTLISTDVYLERHCPLRYLAFGSLDNDMVGGQPPEQTHFARVKAVIIKQLF